MYHQQQISVAPWSNFTTRSITEKQITGNEKNLFWRLGRVKISSQSNDKKKKKKKKTRLILIKKAELKNEEKGKDNENLQDMCKNHQGLQQ